MVRWLSCGLVALGTLSLIAADRVPTTQPAVPQLSQMRDLQQTLDQVQADLDAAKSNLDGLSKLPPIAPWRFQANGPLIVVPALPEARGRFDIKPNGPSFQFNGVTVYVEPVASALKR